MAKVVAILDKKLYTSCISGVENTYKRVIDKLVAEGWLCISTRKLHPYESSCS